ncbi:MAG: recombinase, partial [Clostridiales bacterium]|nr:recombinase [Clostridiales bacterium]
SYSVLQADFVQHMRAAGYTDVERGERGSSEEHLTVTQFKVMQEEKRLEGLTEKIQQSGTELAAVQQQLTSGHDAIQQMESDTRKAEKAADAAEKKMTKAEQALRTQSMTFMKIDSMGKKTLTGNIAFAPDDAEELKELAKKGVTADRRISDLEDKVARAQKDVDIWKQRYKKLLDQVQNYLAAVQKAPERVADFLRRVIQERDIPQRRQPNRTHSRDMER